MKLVVGLGNPGARYQHNRHNVGFHVLDQLALVHGMPGWQSRFDGLAADCMAGGEKVLLLKPMTYMNRSGIAVRKAVDFFKLDLADVLVVCDDFAIPLGKLRIRGKGSAGGQNGLKDIFAHLGTDQVARLRVGIGAPPGNQDPADFVLSDFSAADRRVIADAVITAGQAVEAWAKHGVARVMNDFNGSGSAKE